MIPGEIDDSGGTDSRTQAEPARAAASRLEGAFDRHLGRERYADCARVVVHDGDAGRYEYVDGVHYVTEVDRDARRRLEAFVERRDLTVVMDGRCGFAFRHHEPAPAADAHVAGIVVSVAFDAAYAELTEVVEVLDASTELSWTDSDTKHA